MRSNTNAGESGSLLAAARRARAWAEVQVAMGLQLLSAALLPCPQTSISWTAPAAASPAGIVNVARLDGVVPVTVRLGKVAC